MARIATLLLFTLIWLPAAAAAQDGAASAWDGGASAEARLVSALTAVGPGGEMPLGLQFRMAPGWKLYWRSPGAAGFPPALDWTGSENLEDAQVRWPAPHRFSLFGLETAGYEDEVVLPLPARALRPGEPADLRLAVDYLVCSDICVPERAELSLALPAGPAAPSGHAHLLDRWRARVPVPAPGAGLDLAAPRLAERDGRTFLAALARSDEPFAAPDLFVEAPAAFGFGAPEIRLAEGGRTATFEVPVEATGAQPASLAGRDVTLTLVDGPRAVELSATVGEAAGAATGGLAWRILAVALLGGLILNLMPCVLPVLSLKLASAVGLAGGGRGAVRRGFLATAAGILVSFLALAALAIGMKQAGLAVGWGIQFQQPLFLAAMAVVVTLFAANLWGLFELGLPGGLGGRLPAEGGGRGLAGHFLTGVFATLLATPCSAPFVGTAVGFALSRGAGEILAIFAAMGLGLALPYLAVAAFPGTARLLPRPGPWFVWLRGALGLALAGTAAWLVWVLAGQVGWTAAGLVAALLAGLVAVLALRRSLGGVARAGLAALMAAAVVAAAAIAPTGGVLPRDSGPDARWAGFDPTSIPALVDSGKVVFVDVTADWCVTCVVNKRLVLDTDAVRALLEGEGVVAMQADWTLPDPAIAGYLARFGRYGIPFNAVYGPGAPQGIALPELLSAEAVRDALAEAGSAVATAAR